MRWKRPVRLAISFFALLPVLCSATSMSFTGAFSADNQEQSFDLPLTTETIVEARTWSYAGGVDAAGALIPAGGFAPEISIFDAVGTLIALDAVGGTAPGQCYG